MDNSTETCREIRLDPRPGNWTPEQREHVGRCPGCRSFLASLTALGERLLGLPSANRKMPDALRRELLARLNESSGPQFDTARGKSRATRPALFGRGIRYLVPVAMAASLTFGVVLENRYDIAPTPMPNELGEVQASVGDYLHDVTHDHYLFDRIQHPLEVEMSEASALSEWLSGALAFDFRLPADSGSFALEGGRVWHTVGRLSAMAVYRTADGTRVVLFAVPAENMTLDGAESRVIGQKRVFRGSSWGHEGRAWIQGDLAVSLTAPEGRFPDGWKQIFLP